MTDALDLEARFLSIAVKTLTPLDRFARERLLSYLYHRFTMDDLHSNMVYLRSRMEGQIKVLQAVVDEWDREHPDPKAECDQLKIAEEQAAAQEAT